MAPTCFRHPDRPGRSYCARYNRYLCEECLACQSPELYCKFRTMCMVWEEVKHGGPEGEREKERVGGGGDDPA